MENLSKELAYLAYRAAIEEIAEIQQRYALRIIVQKEFEKDSLPLREFYRHMPLRQETLKRAEELSEKERSRDHEQLGKLYEIVTELEAMFERYHAADDQAWAEAMADYLKQRRRG
jgi:hypothetical protein